LHTLARPPDERFKGDGPMLEAVCAQNNGDFFNQNLFPQPEAKTPDF
jgi:hypothetical protein